MSRCFPFPPPGYEKKFKAENLDLLAKEKHREKKHKKEKRDKEKREHKDKREKDRNKDKHKEKKDRKEKHKDRKKVKDIDKGRAPEGSRAENQAEDHNELHIHESLQKAEEVKDSKFAEELGRRTRDDGASNQLVGSITSSSIHRKFEGVGAGSPSLEKEKSNEKKVFPIHIGSAQRNYGSGLPFENVANSLQRRAENISTANSMEKERSKIHEKVTVGIMSEPNRNHGISRPENFPWLVNRKTEYSTAGMEKEKSGEKIVIANCTVSPLERGQLGAKVFASSSVSTQKRNNAVGLSAENVPLRCKNEVTAANSSLHGRMEGVCSVPASEKERIKGKEMFPRPVSSEQRTKTSIGQPVEKDRYQKLDGKDTKEKKKDEDKKRFEVGDNNEKKNKPKDTDRHSNEKKEKIVKAEKIENDKTRNVGKKDKVDTLNSKPLAPHKDITTGITRDVDVTMRKRKDLKTNGFLHENDARPSKMPRLTSSPQPPVNDRTLELHLEAPFSLPLKDGAMNNMKPDRTLGNNEKKINGTANSQQLAIEARPPAGRGLLENGDVSLKLPHPDSKYLRQIYAVPKMEAWSEADDLDWLLKRCDSQQKPRTKHDSENAPQVWAEALQIDSDDAFALPYVVPF